MAWDFTGDLKVIKELLARQAGKPACGCFCCDRNTNTPMTVAKPPVTAFTDEIMWEKSKAWVELWKVYCLRTGLDLTAAEFEKEQESKDWSALNMSFAGEIGVPEGLSLDQFIVDYLHLTLRLVPVIFPPIVQLVTTLVENGFPGVAWFVAAMNAIGLGHIARRFQKKYGAMTEQMPKQKKKKKTC